MKEVHPAGRPIFLCGFMGVGKTTVGKLLAAKRACAFIDLDLAIETAAAKPITAIFKDEGEAGFRVRESKVLRSLPLVNSVIALGGGALTRAENFAYIAEHGVLIYLSASVEVLLQRLHAATELRPLLAGLTAAEQKTKIAQLLGEREAIYQKAPVEILTSGLSADKVAEKINASLTERAS